MTSSTWNLERRSAAIPAQAAPAMTPAPRPIHALVALCVRAGSDATAVAAEAPASNCPSAPMLKTPARKAIATESPVRINGVARTSVPDVRAYAEPNDPVKSALAAGEISKPSARRMIGTPSTTMASTKAARVIASGGRQ